MGHGEGNCLIWNHIEVKGLTSMAKRLKGISPLPPSPDVSVGQFIQSSKIPQKILLPSGKNQALSQKSLK